MIDFVKYHARVEAAIADAGRRKKLKTAADMKSQVFPKLAEVVVEMCREFLRLRPVKERRGVDECWLSIWSMALASTCWAAAVARGKATDGKRDRTGREGWLGKSRQLLSELGDVVSIGLEIAAKKMFEEGDMSLEVPLGVAHERFLEPYKRRHVPPKGRKK